jgi:hypothetical protein
LACVAQDGDALQLSARDAQISARGSLAETAAFALGGWLRALNSDSVADHPVALAALVAKAVGSAE